MAVSTHPYRAYLVAVAVVLACVAAAWRLSPPAGAAPASARDDNHLICGGLLKLGADLTHIVVKAEKKRDEDSWRERPIRMRHSGVGFTWSTRGAPFRGCSNAITFAVADARRDSALIRVTLAQSFGAGAKGRTAACQVLSVSHTNDRYTCHRDYEDHLNGRLSALFTVTSP